MKTRLFSCAALCALAMMAAQAPPAAAAADAVVQQAAADIQAGRAAEAYAALAPLARQRAGDPDFDYVLGLAAADSGRPAEAIIAFQRVLAVQPDNAPARAEIARAYALAGDVDTAKSQFDTVVDDPSLPDPVRQRFNRIVRDLDRQVSGGDADVSGFFDVAAGYDTNVNSATDLTEITIPLFAALGPGALGPTAQATEDDVLEVQGAMSAVLPLDRQSRLFASLLGAWRDNRDSDLFDQASATLSVGGAHTLASRGVLSVSVQGQQFWLAQNSYRQTLGLVGQYTHPLQGGRALTAAVQYFHLDYENDPLRDAERYGAAVSYVGRDFIATASGGQEQTRRAAGDHLSYWYGGLNAGFEHSLSQGLAVAGSLGGEVRRYDAADPLFLVSREDEQADASLSLKWLVTPYAYVRPRVGYTRNWSNIALYDYDRVTASLGVRFEF